MRLPGENLRALAAQNHGNMGNIFLVWIGIGDLAKESLGKMGNVGKFGKLSANASIADVVSLRVHGVDWRWRGPGEMESPKKRDLLQRLRRFSPGGG